MSGEPADPYAASRETPPHEPYRRADPAVRHGLLNHLASEARTRWPG
ncbi:hypothetical protein ACWIID_17970 [Streptomyces phaeochromogenes]